MTIKLKKKLTIENLLGRSIYFRMSSSRYKLEVEKGNIQDLTPAKKYKILSVTSPNLVMIDDDAGFPITVNITIPNCPHLAYKTSWCLLRTPDSSEAESSREEN